MRSFKENLREELDFQGITVKELAAKTGIIKGSIDNYLSARESIPSADIAVKIAKVLGVSVEYLVTGKDDFFSKNSQVQKQLKRTMLEMCKIPEPMRNSIEELIRTAAKTCEKTCGRSPSRSR